MGRLRWRASSRGSRRTALAAAVLMTVLGGCDTVASLFRPQSQFEVVFPAAGEPGGFGIDPLPVRVRDETGMIRGVRLAPDAAMGDEGVRDVDSRLDAIHVGWFGGMCDESVFLTVRPSALVGYEIDVATRRAGGICPAAAIGRAVVIEFSAAISPDAFRVTSSEP